jgi:hypothetical protein
MAVLKQPTSAVRRAAPRSDRANRPGNRTHATTGSPHFGKRASPMWAPDRNSDRGKHGAARSMDHRRGYKRWSVGRSSSRSRMGSRRKQRRVWRRSLGAEL